MFSSACQSYFAAMAHHKLGHAVEAQQWYDKAAQPTKKLLPDENSANNYAISWNQRWTQNFLQAEAAKLLNVSLPSTDAVVP